MYRLRATGLLALVGLGCGAPPVSLEDDDTATDVRSEALSAAWPEARRTPRRTGFNPYEDVITLASAPSLHVDWQASVSGLHRARGDGMLFVSGDEPGPVNALRASDGSLIWSQPGRFVGPGAATRDSYAVAGPDAQVTVLNARTGDVERTVSGFTGDDARVAPPLSANGDVAFESDASFEECVPRDLGEVCTPRRTIGLLREQRVLGATVFDTYLPFGIGVPARANGKLFVVGSDLSLFASGVAAVSAVDGSMLWQSEWVLGSGAAPLHPPAVLHGRVFALVGANWLRTYDERSGRLLWEYQSAASLNGLVVSDTSVFLLSGPDELGLHVEALDALNGELERRTAIPASVVSGEFVATRELLLGGVDERLLVLDSASLEVVAALHVGKMVGSPLVANGNIYMSSADGTYHIVP